MIGRDGKDKVGMLLVSVPKSGTHLLIEIMQQTFGSYFLYRGGWGDPPQNSVDWINKVLFSDKAMDDPLLSTMKRTRAMAPNHTNESGFSVLAEAIKNSKNIKGIFLYRDPRDILISMVHSTTSGIWPEGHLAKELNKLPDDSARYSWMLDNGGPGRSQFSRILASYAPYLKSDLFLKVRYEDLITSRKGGFKNTQGKTVDALANLTSCCSLEMAQGVVTATNRSTWTHRKGGARAGQWKKVFNDQVKNKAKQVLGQQLINWGYEGNKEW